LKERNRERTRRREESLSATSSQERERPESRDNSIKDRKDLYNINPPPQRRRLDNVKVLLKRAYIIRLEKLNLY